MSRLQRLIASHGLSATAMAMPWPALLAVTWHHTHSGAALGLVGAARMAPYVLLSWAAGSLGDRVPRSVLVKGSTRLRVVLLALTTLAVASDRLGTAVVLATLVVVAGTPAYPAIAASMPATAGARSETATGWLVTLEVSAFVVGPALGGVLLTVAGAQAAVLVAVLVAATASVLLTGVTVGESRPSRGTPAVPERLLPLVLNSAGTARVIAAVAVINLVIGAVGVALLPMAEHTWGDEDAFGLLTAAVGFGALGTPVVRRFLRLPPTAIRAALVLVSLPLLLVAATPAWRWALVPLFMLGAAATEVECVATTIIQRSVPDRARAFALGLTDSVMVTGALIGAVLAPWTAQTFGPRTLLIGCAAATASLLLVGAPRRPAEQSMTVREPQFT